MSVQEKMYKETKKPGSCITCDGRIEITRQDFDEVAEYGPDTDAQFEELVRRATAGAEAKCNGCDIFLLESHYDKQTLNGVIHCHGYEPNSIPMS